MTMSYDMGNKKNSHANIWAYTMAYNTYARSYFKVKTQILKNFLAKGFNLTKPSRQLPEAAV